MAATAATTSAAALNASSTPDSPLECVDDELFLLVVLVALKLPFSQRLQSAGVSPKHYSRTYWSLRRLLHLLRQVLQPAAAAAAAAAAGTLPSSVAREVLEPVTAAAAAAAAAAADETQALADPVQHQFPPEGVDCTRASANISCTAGAICT